MIELLADENVEGGVLRLLRAEGYNVVSIQETKSGVADETVLETAVSSATVLLTGDSDFGKLHFQKGLFIRVFCSIDCRERLLKKKVVLSSRQYVSTPIS